MNVRVIEDTVCSLTGEHIMTGDVLKDVDEDISTAYLGFWYGTLVSIPVDDGAIVVQE